MTTQPTDAGAGSGGAGGAAGSVGPAGSAGPAEREAAQYTKPYRQLAAFVLLGANAVFLLLALLELFVDLDNFAAGFTRRADTVFGEFVGLVPIGLPLLAVLIATHVRPVVAAAKVVTVLALVEYGVSALFGLVCLFAGFVADLTADEFASGSVGNALQGFVARLTLLALLALAVFLVLLVYRGLFMAARQPRPQPRPYGYPAAAGYPYPGQPAAGYPYQAAQPTSGPPGQPYRPYPQPQPYAQPYPQQAYQPARPYQQPQPYQQAYHAAPPPGTGTASQAPTSGPPAYPPFGAVTAPPFGAPAPPPPFEPSGPAPGTEHRDTEQRTAAYHPSDDETTPGRSGPEEDQPTEATAPTADDRTEPLRRDESNPPADSDADDGQRTQVIRPQPDS